jgi:CDP-diacylglycerol---glycerol-3-phosphate 3-phosphatidyltransferase
MIAVLSSGANSNINTMNLPNYLTLSRIGILFVIAACFFESWPGSATLAFFLFILASLTDWLDGYIARRYNMVSDFGKLMDALADKVLIVGMFIVLLSVQEIPQWTVYLILVIMGREFLVTGLRLIAASKGQVLQAEKAGKIKTVTQIVCICIFMLHRVMTDDFKYFGIELEPQYIGWIYQTGLIVFVLAAVLTFVSGYGYMSRYWHLLGDNNK